MDLADAYRACARLTRREARNFYYAFLSLRKRQRSAVYALYAFCRAADDAADGPAPEMPLAEAGAAGALSGGSTEGGSPSVEGRRERLGRLRGRLARAAAGNPEEGPDLALADAIAAFGVEPADLADVLTGIEMDLTLRRIATFDELRSYCYYVASAVGLATLPVLNDGIPPTGAMREAAADLGLGMQLVNVLRDVAEDLDRDRIYLPADEMAARGVDEASLRRRPTTDEVKDLFARHADRAGEWLERGRRLLPMLPRTGRRCVWLLAEIYGRILTRIRSAGYDVFSGRASLSSREKLALLAASFWRRW